MIAPTQVRICFIILVVQIFGVACEDSARRERDDRHYLYGPPPNQAPVSQSTPPPNSPPVLVGCEDGAEEGPLPSNGHVWRYTRKRGLAPLEIRTTGTEHYLVKAEQNGEVIASMHVRPGSTAEVLLPLGIFEVKYATGTGEYWCGQDAKFPFGRQTQFFRADDIFHFKDEGDYYSGYTLELFLQPDGNMQTVSLAADEW